MVAVIVLALTFAASLVVVAVPQIGPSPQVGPGPPPPPDSYEPVDEGEVKRLPELTEEEKERFMRIIMSNDSVRRILDKENWTILEGEIGVRTEGWEKIGASAVFIFDTSVWVEGTFNNPSFSYTAKLWAGNIHVDVDLRTNSTVHLYPGMWKAIDKVPLDEELAAAERIALNHLVVKSLGEDIESYLNAVYYIPDYPQGMAVFNVRSDLEEVMVTIDLDKMVVVEKYTGRIVVPGQ